MFTTLAFTITGGMFAILATARVEQIAWKFLRLVGILMLAVAAVPTAWTLNRHGFPLAGKLGVTTLCAASLVIILAPVSGKAAILFRIISAFGGAAAFVAASISAGSFMSRAGLEAMVIAAQVFSGLLLGSITLAWLLGHAYLTATSMTIAPLRHFSRMLSWTVTLRIAFLCASVVLAWATGRASIFAQLADAWLIVFLRVGVGLVAVAVFAYMVSDCVRRRSTQSATGILYFGSVMAYVGELAGQQLAREIGWPL